MTKENKYIYRSKISETKLRQLVRLFCVDFIATQVAHIPNLSRNTVNRLLQGISERIAFVCAPESPVFGELEVDESYLRVRCARRPRGR